MSETSWYKKNPTTMNSKLRKAIIDALPLDLDEKQADIILRTVFDTIVEGVVRDGFVTIQGLGRFYSHVRPAHRRGRMRWIQRGKKCIYIGVKHYPERTELRFIACDNLRRSLDD